MSVIKDPPPEVKIDPFVHAVWCLIYGMKEAGAKPDKWWEQDFWMVERMLEERGLNTDPSKND